MGIRIAWWSLASILSMLLAIADDHDTAARAQEEAALRAQLDRADTDLQALETQLHTHDKEHPEDDTGRTALRDRIHVLDHEEDKIEKRLRVLVAQDPPEMRNVRPTSPVIEDSRPVAPTPASPPEASPESSPASPPEHGTALRSAADATIYEKAAGKPIGTFRWVPVGTHQIAVYTTYDQAYLLDLEGASPNLLTTDRIEVENFSTRVIAGKDGVVANGARCPITQIRELHVNRLPE